MQDGRAKKRTVTGTQGHVTWIKLCLKPTMLGFQLYKPDLLPKPVLPGFSVPFSQQGPNKETFRNGAVCDDSKVPRTKFDEFQRKPLMPQDSRGSRAGKHYKTEHFYMKKEHSQRGRGQCC